MNKGTHGLTFIVTGEKQGIIHEISRVTKLEGNINVKYFEFNFDSEEI